MELTFWLEKVTGLNQLFFNNILTFWSIFKIISVKQISTKKNKKNK